ncbi:hypothetical protein ATB96_19075 [Elizabethkingia ursingii]|nr:hypothetical protein ATB96_19075 [Elizabethkingia ursingii]
MLIKRFRKGLKNILICKKYQKERQMDRLKTKDFDFWAHQNSLSIFFLVPDVYFSNCNAGISFHSVMQNTFLSFEKLGYCI